MRRLAVSVAVAAAAIGAAVVAAVASHRAFHHQLETRTVPGGQLMPDVRAYDRLSGLLLASLFRGIARDVAATAPGAGAVLEVGCGPGYLSIGMARDHGLAVTALDLDPDMIATAKRHAAGSGTGRKPTFVVGDAAALPFDDASFDVVVSTFSLHHWTDPERGLSEIARVVRPDGTVLIWDFDAGGHLLHPEVHDPLAPIAASPLRTVSVRPWAWPWRFHLCQRMEFARS